MNILPNFPGYLISALIVLQYFGSNGTVLDTGFNHTLVLQCLVCALATPFLYVINKEKALYIVGILLLFLLFTIIHYELVSSINDYRFNLSHLFTYVKYSFYLFVFSVIYHYFEDKDFIVITRYAKYIVLVLFLESLFYIIFKVLGLDQAILFEGAQGRFSGIFLSHNTLVSLFALFVMSHVIFFGSLREKILYLTIGVTMIVLTAERSAILGILFLMFAYVLFSYDKPDSVTKDKIKIFFTFSLIVVVFVVLYTMFIRGYDIQTLGQFLRPIILRVYFMNLSIIDLFESDSSIVGFGPFIHSLPTNFADMYSDYVEKFINVVAGLFGSSEEAYLRSWHDPNYDASYRLINAHNTFALLFYQFGYFFICLLLYCLYLFLVSMNYVRQSLKEIVTPSVKSQEILNKNEIFFQISSLAFIIASLPALLFLSMNNYLIFTVIALGLVGAFVRKLSNE